MMRACGDPNVLILTLEMVTPLHHAPISKIAMSNAVILYDFIVFP
jgi:hypothetical protein